DAKTLSAFEALHEDLSALKSLAPDEPVLQQWQRRLHTVLDGEIQSQVAQGAYDGAQALLAQYADIASAEYVETQRALLETGCEDPVRVRSAARRLVGAQVAGAG